MFKGTDSEHTLAFIGMLAAQKADRAKFLDTSKKQVAHMLASFDKDRLSSRHEMLKQFNENQKMQAAAENKRLKEFKHFQHELLQQDMARKAATEEASKQTNKLLAHFHHERFEMRLDLSGRACTLASTMKLSEEQRMSEFQALQNMLARKKKERLACLDKTIKEARTFLKDCHCDRMKMSTALHKEFAAAADSRAEITMAWAALRHGRMKDRKAPQQSMPMPDKEMNAPAPPEAAMDSSKSKAVSTIKLKLKATISSFPKGCKFSEIQRSLDNFSKDAIKEALIDLLSCQELRKDDQDRYHLI